MPRGVARVLVAIGLVLTLGAATALAVAAQGQAPGAVVVTLLDPNGAPLPGGCFGVSSNMGAVSYSCDYADGSTDGTTILAHVPPGTYGVYEYFLPPGYLYAAQEQPVTVLAGQNAAVTLRPQPGGASVAITIANAQNQPLPGACYTAYVDTGQGVPGAGAGEGCDIFDANNDGKTSFGGLPTGAYVVVQSTTPNGYVAPVARRLTLTAGQTATVSTTLQPGGQTLTVTDVDQQGQPVLGDCFRVYQDAGNGQRGAIVAVSCDNYYDFKLDGVITVRGLLPGRYVLVQPGPLPGFTVAPDQPFVVQQGQDLALTATTARTAAATAASSATSSPAAGAFAVGATVTVTANGVNLRGRPSTSGSVVGTLNAGEQVTITGAPTTADGYTWYPVRAANGAQGYVAGAFLQGR